MKPYLNDVLASTEVAGEDGGPGGVEPRLVELVDLLTGLKDHR